MKLYKPNEWVKNNQDFQLLSFCPRPKLRKQVPANPRITMDNSKIPSPKRKRRNKTKQTTSDMQNHLSMREWKTVQHLCNSLCSDSKRIRRSLESNLSSSLMHGPDLMTQSMKLWIRSTEWITCNETTFCRRWSVIQDQWIDKSGTHHNRDSLPHARSTQALKLMVREHRLEWTTLRIQCLFGAVMETELKGKLSATYLRERQMF